MMIVVVALIGFAAGITSGLFGVGGGVIFVPLLMLLMHVESHVAVATSIAVIVPTALVAAVRYAKAGMVDWRSFLILTMFAIAGAWIGVGLSLKLEANMLRRLFAVFLFIMSLKLFFQK
ncbi:MAG: sulfite exporter TauE/SafE family protein [Candidatus Omnitrophica bacterium]|nr:sulfite exporter TauE/SafE family protein [Candidatus Omnitrophota bacterium]MDD5670020.1 sulfite exporter TauE/SafE family protein [Candidatus Omnitrophota bacterium]